jgi:hypothetical protein
MKNLHLNVKVLLKKVLKNQGDRCVDAPRVYVENQGDRCVDAPRVCVDAPRVCVDAPRVCVENQGDHYVDAPRVCGKKVIYLNLNPKNLKNTTNPLLINLKRGLL